MDADELTPRHSGATSAIEGPTPVEAPLTGDADATQLRLLEVQARQGWRLDESTRAIGRQGVEQARAALRSPRSHAEQAHHDEPHPGRRHAA